MTYKRTVWENGVTPINAANLNNMEDGIVEAKTEVRPFEAGGTNADSAAAARQSINFIGTNPIESVEDDTPANWAALGNGVVFYNGTGQLTDQPTQYGLLQNIVRGDGGTDVHQIWLQQASSSPTMWHRCGNNNGWQGTWKKILDENNGIQKKLLWQIANYAIQFPPQTINVDFSGYTHYEVIFMIDNASYAGVTVSSGITQMNKGAVGVAGWGDTNGIYHRRVTTIAADYITFGDAYYNKAKGTQYMIPMAIYGIKGVQ